MRRVDNVWLAGHEERDNHESWLNACRALVGEVVIYAEAASEH